ncbi:probable cytochrome P450 CYP44 isoform X1 [Macrobrachium nipponense]|uniref:probable cytochrome P450 CYP44 isoform X1 n=1 Tax=Macrobrachium nipponense TaxID=159736 RepID=UPI0030C7F1FC
MRGSCIYRLLVNKKQFSRIPSQSSQHRAHSLQARCFSSASSSIPSECVHEAKPFSSIPGPPRIPILGTLLPYKLGFRKLPAYHKDICELFEKYGPVIREIFGSQIIVHVYDPSDIRQVYENDGKTPHIPPLQETTQFYRQQKDMSLGLGNINGEDWYKLRHAVRQMMLRPKEVSYYYPLQDGVAKQAVDLIQERIDNNGVVPGLHFLVGKWILESAGMCCFEKSLGSFCNDDRGELAQKMVEANIEIFKLSAELKFSLRLYRFFQTPKYQKLHDIEDFFYGVSIQFITETIREISNLAEEGRLEEGKFNFLSYLMSRKELSEKDVITITLSLFSDGLSTTAPTLLGNLHCLALNPKAQDRLYQEIMAHVDPDAPITLHTVNKLHYMKAFVKEVFRFYPIGESVQRLPQKDLVLGGYHIPAGTYVDLNPYVWLQSEQYFKRAKSFQPERWLREAGVGPLVDPYILNPFSIGTRMCAGRRFAEQDLYVGMCRLLQKFRIEATSYEPPEQEWRILLRPKTPLPIRFLPRE